MIDTAAAAAAAGPSSLPPSPPPPSLNNPPKLEKRKTKHTMTKNSLTAFLPPLIASSLLV
jgi:hypothetical protein